MVKFARSTQCPGNVTAVIARMSVFCTKKLKLSRGLVLPCGAERVGSSLSKTRTEQSRQETERFGRCHQKGRIGKGRVSLFGVPRNLEAMRNTFSTFSMGRRKRFGVFADDPNLSFREPQTRLKFAREDYKISRNLT